MGVLAAKVCATPSQTAIFERVSNGVAEKLAGTPAVYWTETIAAWEMDKRLTVYDPGRVHHRPELSESMKHIARLLRDRIRVVVALKPGEEVPIW